jgi:hypothetical protein
MLEYGADLVVHFTQNVATFVYQKYVTYFIFKTTLTTLKKMAIGSRQPGSRLK